MPRRFHPFMVTVFLFLSTSSIAMDRAIQKNESEIKKFAPWVAFKNLEAVKRSAKDKLMTALGVDEAAVSDITVSRLFTSDLYQVVIDGESYITNDTTQYWISGNGIGNLFMFGDSVTPVNASNETREYLIKMTQLAKLWPNATVSFGPESPKERIFALVDLRCPHCREFHLTKRENWQNKGFQFTYLPMTPDPEDKKQQRLHEGAFCIPDQASKKEIITSIYLDGINAGLDKVDGVTCSSVDKSIYLTFMQAGIKYGLSGTPLFVTEAGNLLYGVSSLERYLKSVK